MQWDAAPNAGFAPAGVRTWLPLAADYAQRNVAVEEQDPSSMLSYFRALTSLRQSSPALMVGAYQAVDTPVADIFAYTRTYGDERLLVVLNFSGGSYRLDFSRLSERGEILFTSGMLSKGPLRLNKVYVEPNEGIVLRLG